MKSSHKHRESLLSLPLCPEPLPSPPSLTSFKPFPSPHPCHIYPSSSDVSWTLDCISLCPPCRHTHQTSFIPGLRGKEQAMKHHPDASCLLFPGSVQITLFSSFSPASHPSRTPSDSYCKLELWHLRGPLGPWQIANTPRGGPRE